MQQTTDTLTIIPIDGVVVSNETLVDDAFRNEEHKSNDETILEAHPNFIESNTSAISLEELSEKCIIPTFCNNELTISHQNFIYSVVAAAQKVFGALTPVECRVSHPIIGRVPTAIHKRNDELRDDEKTIFYQRLAWVCHVIGLSRTINGQEVNLCIGGVRAYNEDRLYAQPAPQKMRVFIGWQVRVCSNLCLTCNGFTGSFECMTEADIFQKSLQLFSQFNAEKEDTLQLLENLHNTWISEEQFCTIVGRMRLYQALPLVQQRQLPDFIIGDQAVNAAVRNYVNNPNFGRREEDTISCWDLMQLLNEAVKQAYIDKWLERNQNCTDFAIGIQHAIQGNDTEGYSWFLN